MASRFVFNPAGVEELAVGAEMHGLMNETMDAAKGAAEALAPRESGEYADSFTVEKNETASLYGHDRAVARLRNTAPYAAALEFGRHGDDGRETPAYRVLGRALEALGE